MTTFFAATKLFHTKTFFLNIRFRTTIYDLYEPFNMGSFDLIGYVPKTLYIKREHGDDE
jgi:hypothetical protein